jgi:hypothetical protein
LGAANSTIIKGNNGKPILGSQINEQGPKQSGENTSSLLGFEYQVHIQHSSVFVFPFGTAATIYQILKLNE